jgi:hypothetical protein
MNSNRNVILSNRDVGDVSGYASIYSVKIGEVSSSSGIAVAVATG